MNSFDTLHLWNFRKCLPHQNGKPNVSPAFLESLTTYYDRGKCIAFVVTQRELILEIVGSLLLVQRLNGAVFMIANISPGILPEMFEWQSTFVKDDLLRRSAFGNLPVVNKFCLVMQILLNICELRWDFYQKCIVWYRKCSFSGGSFSDREPSPKPVFQPMVSDCLPVCWSLQQHAAEQERVSLKACIGLTEGRSDKDKKTCQEVNQLSWESS